MHVHRNVQTFDLRRSRIYLDKLTNYSNCNPRFMHQGSIACIKLLYYRTNDLLMPVNQHKIQVISDDIMLL